ncbi:MAG: hypothetical protein KAI29_13460, partial [Cyclobacteriaceae bacterium]|nr:hypothetical protein [Cyclobacteriaceae bacterium]
MIYTLNCWKPDGQVNYDYILIGLIERNTKYQLRNRCIYWDKLEFKIFMSKTFHQPTPSFIAIELAEFINILI